MAEGGFGSFNPDVDVSSVGARWSAYKIRFENFMIARTNKKFAEIDDVVKKASFLHHVGERVFEMYQSVEKKEHTFKQMITELDQFFVEKINVEYEKYVFSQAKQARNEQFDCFVNRLRVLAKNCGFVDKDSEIKSRIIQGCFSETLRIRALTENLDINELINLGRNMEVAKAQSSSIFDEKPKIVAAVSERNTESMRRVAKKCGFCGQIHKPGPDSCPAKGKKCNKCSKRNHFSSVCRSAAGSTAERKWKPKASVNHVTEEKERYEDYVFSVSENSISLPMVTVKLGDENLMVEMLIDTGCSLNIIDECSYGKFLNKPRLEPIKGSVFAFQNKSPLRFAGEFTIEVKYNERSVLTRVAVVSGSEKCLLGFKTASELGLVKILSNVEKSLESSKQEIDLEYLKEKYPRVFSGKLGNLKDFEIRLDIDKSVQPVYRKHDRIPFHLRGKLEEIIQKGLADGVFEEAKGPTSWLLPAMLVPKSEGRLRFVIDASPANRAIKRTRYVLPTIEDLITDVNGAKYFSKVDLNEGFHQCTLAEESRELTTFRTHFGIFRYKRLLMGINAAPELFHRAIETQIVHGLDGVRNVMDDILVFGETREQHDERVNKLFDRMDKKGLTVNERKCAIGKAEVEFYGLKFSSEGIGLTEDKTRALREAAPPTSPGEVSSLLGLSTYCDRFIENHADIVDPLRKLTRSKSQWNWGEKEDNALNKLKKAATGKILGYYNTKWDTELIVDASPTGLGAILIQRNPRNREDIRIIAYASRSLTDVERRYSQIEKECLAIVWGCEKFHIYLYGRRFKIVTDNKALEFIFKRNGKKTPARIERWSIRLNEYDFEVLHRPGKDNPADYLSRKPLDSGSDAHGVQESVESYVNYVFEYSIPKSISHEEIVNFTKQDPVLQELIRRIRGSKFNFKNRKSIQFDNCFHELSVTSQGVVMRNDQIVMPNSLTDRVIDIAHEGHQGITKTKALIRSKVWFPKMDQLVQNKLNNCYACMVNTAKVDYRPLRMTEMPDGPWQNLSIDFYGPTPSLTMLLVLLCDYSRFALVEELTSTVAKVVIKVLHTIWVTFGIPFLIKTDNGPPFNSQEFENFCSVFGVKHRLITPYWPRANGEVEQFNRNLTKVMRNAAVKGIPWQMELNFFLGSYRASDHTSTGVPPASLIFRYLATSRLTSVSEKRLFDKNETDEKARTNDQESKAKMKDYADSRMKAKELDLAVDDWVLYQKPRGKIYDKKEPVRDVSPWRVESVNGTMVTAKSSDGNVVTRNASLFKKINSDARPVSDSGDNASSTSDVQSQAPRRSTRSTKGVIDRLQLNFDSKSYTNDS